MYCVNMVLIKFNKIPKYINSLHISMDSPLRYHFSSGLILPRFLKMTTFDFNKFTCRLYSFEHTCTTLIIFWSSWTFHVVNYGCEVWEFHKGTSNYMVNFELGRFPLYINRYCRMLQYVFYIPSLVYHLAYLHNNS
jgi:hypothetical protein